MKNLTRQQVELVDKTSFRLNEALFRFTKGKVSIEIDDAGIKLSCPYYLSDFMEVLIILTGEPLVLTKDERVKRINGFMRNIDRELRAVARDKCIEIVGTDEDLSELNRFMSKVFYIEQEESYE